MAIVLGDQTVGATVPLKFNGAATDFLVAHQGLPSSIYDSSCTGTWLLMKDIYENRQWHSSNSNSYKASTIHTYLNGEFLNLFDADIQPQIKQVKIPYVNGTGYNGSVASGSSGLSVKIFLLSCYEVGFTTSDNRYFPADGAKLNYFIAGNDSAAKAKRVSDFNGSAASWWTRSPRTDDTSIVWLIGSSGSSSGYGCTYSYGIRPALILPSDTKLSEDGTIYNPHGVYIKQSGTWSPTKSVWIKQAGAWSKV